MRNTLSFEDGMIVDFVALGITTPREIMLRMIDRFCERHNAPAR